jgi:sugar phosphate isomerase/epimerase
MASFSVFTKPWKETSPRELGVLVRGMGFDALEFPLRPGYQAEPQHAETELPKLANLLAEEGVRIDSVASELTPPVFAGCAKAGVGLIRTMFMPPAGEDYLVHEASFIAALEKAVPLCEQSGVKVGLQMHYGTGATNTAEMMRIVGRFDPRFIGAVWDAAHSGFAGEAPEQAIDLCWSHLCLVNFKNGFPCFMNRGADGEARFRQYMVQGPDGLCPWPRAVRYLQKKAYSGTWCMPAEYDDCAPEQVEKYASEDLIWLKKWVNG